MRLLVFAHDSSLYGASKSLLALLKEWEKRNDLVVKVLLPYPGKIEDKLKEMNVEYEVIHYPRCIYAFNRQTILDRLRILYNYRKADKSVHAKISGLLQSFKPDVLYTNSSVIKTGYDFSVRYRLPHVWHIREFGWEDYKLKYIPSRQSIQNKISHSGSIFISRALQQYWLGSNVHNSTIIYNGILEQEIKPPSRKFPGGSVTIGLLGAIMPGKGQATAIKAVSILSKSFPGISLRIYGDVLDQAYYEEINSLGRDLHIEHIVSVNGFRDDVEEIYRELDILVNCSEREGFGRTIVEAMGAGIPVVGNNAGGIPEIIEHGTDGLLYNQTAEDLAKQLSLLISDKDLYESISANAINKANAKFTTGEYSKAVYEVLAKAANSSIQVQQTP